MGRSTAVRGSEGAAVAAITVAAAAAGSAAASAAAATGEHLFAGLPRGAAARLAARGWPQWVLHCRAAELAGAAAGGGASECSSLSPVGGSLAVARRPRSAATSSVQRRRRPPSASYWLPATTPRGVHLTPPEEVQRWLQRKDQSIESSQGYLEEVEQRAADERADRRRPLTREHEKRMMKRLWNFEARKEHSLSMISSAFERTSDLTTSKMLDRGRLSQEEMDELAARLYQPGVDRLLELDASRDAAADEAVGELRRPSAEVSWGQIEEAVRRLAIEDIGKRGQKRDLLASRIVQESAERHWETLAPQLRRLYARGPRKLRGDHQALYKRGEEASRAAKEKAQRRWVAPLRPSTMLSKERLQGMLGRLSPG
eukprot:TRINITY_DN56579_c0_g1_i1.p1 TRINITY_DN56579_c0_g1~~TRINITY_DN56579_c0_g1_i1.p1  ORF type:complete len:372 (+),score=111.06 TRINITY_DN56579_c0_g1_i1:96-1211(+)